jgi:predicted ATPase
MELLVDRMDRPEVLRDPVEAAALLQIGRQLEGLPLALELAAARCIALRPSDAAVRLRSRLQLLADDRRADERQQTLQATVQ